MADPTLMKVGPENLEECGIGCLVNSKNPGYSRKVDWLSERFKEGLRFLLFRDEGGKPLAFLEFVPGEFAWRPVDARGWLFVHCLWVYAAGQKIGGLGKRLVRGCIDEAKKANATGVAAFASDGAWMAGSRVFLANGFMQIAKADRFQLVVHRIKKGAEPRFRDIRGNAAKFKGLHLVYADQCPMLTKSATDLAEMAAENGLKLNVTVMKTAKDAQNAPSYYGIFNLLWNGRLIADHYVSKGRFKNILKNDILKTKA